MKPRCGALLHENIWETQGFCIKHNALKSNWRHLPAQNRSGNPQEGQGGGRGIPQGSPRGRCSTSRGERALEGELSCSFLYKRSFKEGICCFMVLLPAEIFAFPFSAGIYSRLLCQAGEKPLVADAWATAELSRPGAAKCCLQSLESC